MMEDFNSKLKGLRIGAKNLSFRHTMVRKNHQPVNNSHTFKGRPGWRKRVSTSPIMFSLQADTFTDAAGYVYGGHPAQPAEDVKPSLFSSGGTISRPEPIRKRKGNSRSKGMLILVCWICMTFITAFRRERQLAIELHTSCCSGDHFAFVSNKRQ